MRSFPLRSPSCLRLLSLAAAGCATTTSLPPPPPNVAATTPVPAASGSASGSLETAPPPTREFTAKDQLVAVRVKGLRRTFDATKELVGAARAALGDGTPEAFASMALGDPLAALLDYDAPADVVAFGSTESPDVAIALGMKIDGDVEARVSELHPVRQPHGVIELRGVRLPCQIWPGHGATTYELICSTNATELPAVGRYIAETLARENVRDDVEAHINAELAFTGRSPLKDPYEERIADYAVAMAKECDDWSIGMTLTETSLEWSMSIALRSKEGPFQRALVESTSGGADLSKGLMTLPADTLGAFAWRGVSRETFAPVRAAAWDWLAKFETDRGVPEAELTKLEAQFQSSVFVGGPMMFAYGDDLRAERDAIAKLKPTTHVNPPSNAWFLLETDERIGNWSRLEAAVDAVEKFQSKQPVLEARKTSSITEPALMAATGLPRGTRHYVQVDYPAKDGKPDKSQPALSRWHLYLVPVVVDGKEHLWLGGSPSETGLLSRLRARLAGETPLAGRRDLSGLRGEAGVMGFASTAFGSAMSLYKAGTAADRLTALNGALHESTPTSAVPFQSSQQPHGDGAIVSIRTAMPLALVKTLISSFESTQGARNSGTGNDE